MIQQIGHECRTAEIGCIDCKKLAADAMVERLTPIWEGRKKLTAKSDQVEEILREGSKRAQAVSHQTLEEVKSAMQI
ncbi:MAG: hypothetical protein ACREI2_07720 [Nitrospiraceae bacterium]